MKTHTHTQTLARNCATCEKYFAIMIDQNRQLSFRYVAKAANFLVNLIIIIIYIFPNRLLERNIRTSISITTMEPQQI